MTETRVDAERQLLHVTWEDGATAAYPFLWLRDNAPSSFHPETRERVFDVTGLADRLDPPQVRPNGATLTLAWPGGPEDAFDLAWLRRHRPGERRADPADLPAHVWRGDLDPGALPRAAAGELLASDAALFDWMCALKVTGVGLVDGLAPDVEAGQEVARRIGFLRETNFGSGFEVMSKPNPNNSAYTADALPMHTDLPNQELPPGYQFLHCLANEAVGGSSILADGRAIAEDVRAEDPESFAVLSTVTVPFRFHDTDSDIRARQRVIALDGLGRVSEVSHSAHLFDVLDLAPEDMVPFYRAFRLFALKARDPAYAIRLRLRGGEMMVFDNRRILHGREAFDPNTGFRHLHGCYVDRGEFDSRLRVLARSHAPREQHTEGHQRDTARA